MSSPSADAPIVVLDSGLGGLTVARSLREVLPHEQILYFGDTARVPYGSKSAATVTSFVREIIAYFLDRSPKHVVIACNTATALGLPAIRTAFPQLSISGVIEPGARAAIDACGAKAEPIIGIIGTEATIRSKAYERAIHRRRHYARMLLRPTPLLVPIIEEGRAADDPLVKLALHQYLGPMLEREIDVLVLGCTHYPILKRPIQAMAGPNVRVIDSAERCAEDVARRLTSAGLLRSACDSPQVEADPNRLLQCFVTDETPRFAALASRFLGFPLHSCTQVSTDALHERDRAMQLRRAS
jgi:glutamate racemase